jgi:hypothetical protein
MQCHAPNAQWIGLILIGPSPKAIERNAEALHSQFTHARPLAISTEISLRKRLP